MRVRGIATALKLRAITSARERGVKTLHSTTGNPAMLTVNERLGYRRTSAEVRLVRRLDLPRAAMPDDDTPSGQRYWTGGNVMG